MIVAADTSPINYLILIEAIDVLPQLYQSVVIPQAVLEELHANETPDAVVEWVKNLPDWLTVAQVEIVPFLPDLDLGETEAIALARELGADALLIDDRAGREEAQRREIFVIGTLGVLNAAAGAELLDLPLTIDRLRQTSFRASEKLLTELLRRDAERRSK